MDHQTVTELLTALGDYQAGNRAEGMFGHGWSAAGELLLDLMPGVPTPAQATALAGLGYVPAQGWPGLLAYTRPGGPDLLITDHDQGQSMRQRVLAAYLGTRPAEFAHWHGLRVSQGRATADEALYPAAQAAWIAAQGWGALDGAARLLSGLSIPWFFAAGWALDLHCGQVSRPHEDTDIVLPHTAQAEVRGQLQVAGLHPWAVRSGVYTDWTEPLKLPDYQAHVQLPAGGMLDLMCTDLSGSLWRYRRDPSITLPLAEARRISVQGWPYLAPQAALLYKSTTSGGQPRPKDQQDFEAVLPHLTQGERGWLAGALPLDHPWRARL